MLRTKRTQVLKNYLVTLLDETEYDLKNHGDQGGCHSPSADNTLRVSLRSRRLERKKERAREKKTHARGEGVLPLPSRVSLSRARSFLHPLLPSAG